MAKPTALLGRFWNKVRKTDGCWLWTAATVRGGYGLFWKAQGNGVMAHRFAYELLVGPIPEGLQLDHLCRVTNCVNPEHLEPVTARENTLRSGGLAYQNTLKTHCPQGHAYDDRSWRRHPSGRMARRCLACHRESQARRNSRKNR